MFFRKYCPNIHCQTCKISRIWCQTGATLQQQQYESKVICRYSIKAECVTVLLFYTAEAVVTWWPCKVKLLISGRATGAYCLWLEQRPIAGTLRHTEGHRVIPRAWRCACKSDQNSGWQVYREQCLWLSTHTHCHSLPLTAVCFLPLLLFLNIHYIFLLLSPSTTH